MEFVKRKLLKHWRAAALITLLVFTIGFFVAEPTLAQTGAAPAAGGSGLKGAGLAGGAGALFTPILDFMNVILAAVAYVVLWVEGKILSMLVASLVWIAKYNTFTKAAAVVQGWATVRDVSNMGFVVVLLIIAIATIVRYEAYNFKKLLPKLLVMAVLVNFSLTITGLFIDVSQVIMLTFVAGFSAGNPAGTIIKGLQITGIWNRWVSPESPTLFEAQDGQVVDALATAGSTLLAIALMTVVIIVVAIMLAVLIGRIVMLWFLAVLSPLAYILSAFPQGLKYSQRWWGELGKYLVVGPTLAFFLWLSLTVMSGNIVGPIPKDDFLLDPLTKQEQQLVQGVYNDPTSWMNMLIGISMLVAALQITSEIGVMGSSFASNWAGKIRQAPIKAAGVALKRAQGFLAFQEARLYAKTGIPLNLARQWSEFSHGVEHRRQQYELQGKGKAALGYLDALKSGSYGGRALAAGKLALASPADFVENWLPIYQSIHRRAGVLPSKFAKKLEHLQGEKAHLEDEKKLVSVQGIGNYGSVPLVQQTAEGLYEMRARGERLETPDFQGADALTNDKVDALLAENKLKPGSDEADAFMKNLYQEQAAKMVTSADKRQYYDADSKSLKDLTPEVLEQYGAKEFDRQIAEVEKEKTTVQAGGLSNEHRKVRETQLEDINRKMLEILKDIRAKGGKGTDEEEGRYKALLEQGKKLEGEVKVKDGREYFGDRPTVQAGAKRNADEDKVFTPEEQKKFITGLTRTIDSLGAQKKLAMDPYEARNAEQQRKRKEIAEQAEHLKHEEHEIEEHRFVAPTPYFALQAYRGMERETISKLPEAMEYSEIGSQLRIAVEEKDVPKVTALLKKAAQDYNDNEFLNQYGYSADYHGMKGFGEEVLVKQLGMSEQQMLQTMNDIAYINESRSHFDTSRMVQVDNGILRWKNELEHAAAVANENTKKNPRNFLQQTNRLGLGGESADGSYKLSLSGKMTLSALQPILVNVLTNRQNEFNPSLLGKLASDMEGLNQAIREGWLDQSTVNLIRTVAAKQTTKPGYSEYFNAGLRAGYKSE